MATEQRQVKCNGCGHIWLSGAMPKNLKCKKCGMKDVTDNYVDPEIIDDSIDEVVDDGVTEQVECDLEGEMVDEQPETESELETAQKESADADIEAEKAVKKAAEKAAVAKSKEPPVCKRCGGDGTWHSNRTGKRAETSFAPLHDPSKPCPECRVPQLMKDLSE